MSHLDDDAIVRLSEGASLTADQQAHLESCAACAEEAADASEVAAMLREGQVTFEEPPPRVWKAISLETGARRQRPSMVRRWPLVAVAAASALVASATTAIVLRDDLGVPTGTLAQTSLVDLGTDADAGTARIEERVDGSVVLVVDVAETMVDDAYLEVWLIDESIEGMVSLGHLTGAHAEFQLPQGLDYRDFPIVDVSVEPLDGVPTHSGDSITRGVFGS